MIILRIKRYTSYLCQVSVYLSGLAVILDKQRNVVLGLLALFCEDEAGVLDLLVMGSVSER